MNTKTRPLNYAGITDIGRVREENQDRWFADPELGLYMVADGMGGTVGGGTAAEAVITILPRLIRAGLNDIDRLDDPEATKCVLGALSEMSDRLRNESQEQLGFKGMGSTVVLVLVQGSTGLVAHLGDSRAYRLREDQLEQLTNDHSIVQLLVEGGHIDTDEAKTHPSRGALTRFVGMDGEAMPEAQFIDIAPGDRLLLCSDGLSGMVGDDQLQSIIEHHPTAEDACESLVSAANEAGGKDNITAVVVSVGATSND